MQYIESINSILKPATEFKYKALDLFAGCGGLSLGFEAMVSIPLAMKWTRKQ